MITSEEIIEVMQAGGYKLLNDEYGILTFDDGVTIAGSGYCWYVNVGCVAVWFDEMFVVGVFVGLERNGIYTGNITRK